MMDENRLFVIMGVAGSGKSTIGDAVAQDLGANYTDGDDLHPASNIEKMRLGIPLTDEDRWPWLARVGETLAKKHGVQLIGCSALKKIYREHITQCAGEPVTFVYLNGSKALIAQRMAERTQHFMPTSLLDSQFDALEIPSVPEKVIPVDISGSITDIAQTISDHIQQIRKMSHGQ